MHDWPQVPLGSVADIFDGPHATPKTVDSGPVFLGIGSLDNGRIKLENTRHVTDEDYSTWTRRVAPKAGDVVFSYETRIGQAGIIPEGLKCCLGRRMGLARVNHKKLNPRFLLYYYLAPGFQEFLRSRTVSGATVDRLAIKEFPSFPISLPPLIEQDAIASTLGALDDKIDCNRRMNETLEAMARAMFKDWFVDFGPTRAKMEGRAPYLAPEIWDLFPDRLDDEGKPEGWEVKPLSDYFLIVGGGTPKTTIPEYWGGSIPWFSVVDTPTEGSVFVVETEKTITEEGLQGSSARLVPEGATIISARGTVGNLAVAAQEMTFNQSCYGLQGGDSIGDFFVYLAAKHMVKQLQSMAHGSVFSTITRQTFTAISLTKPPRPLFRMFESMTSAWFALIKENVIQNKTLAQTRDLLLPKLMSGEIRVKNAERTVERVV